MRKRCISLITAVVVLGSVPSWAQSAPVDLNKAKITWSWTQGTGGAVESWRFTCLPQGQTTPIVKSLADPAARTTPLTTAISAEGSYTCTMAAVNSGGASAESNSVTFQAIKLPVPPTSVTVQP